MNITLIFSLALLVSTVTAACKPNDDSWILMDAPVGGTPTGSFDFDNLGFSIRTPWSYFDSPLAVYNDGAGQVAYIGGATGNLYNYIFQASGGSTWDGGAVWDGFGDKPGYYWLTNDPDNTCYLSFVNPVAIVTLRAQGDANAASINTIEAYDVNDTLIACYSDINERGGTNRYFDLGFRTSIPMKKLVFKGIISMDNFQFCTLIAHFFRPILLICASLKPIRCASLTRATLTPGASTTLLTAESCVRARPAIVAKDLWAPALVSFQWR